MRQFMTLAAAACALVAMAENTSNVTRVLEFLPAPGQFVNSLPAWSEGETQEQMNQKCLTALSNSKSGMISLGAYGGYVTFGFDHPVINIPGEYDFAVYGNAFTDNAEPAVVMVSVDLNNNGLPDDPWYELAGSEYAKSFKHYSVTYTLPDDPLTQAIPWKSNYPADSVGTIDRNNFHKQSYWPGWIDAKTLTFHGTRVPNNAYQQGSIWKFPAYEWGYADNLPNTSNPSFKLEWAVDDNGNPVSLTHADFIKVYTGCQQKAGMTGETSSEISSAEDLHPFAEMPVSEAPVATFEDLGLAQNSVWFHPAEFDQNAENVFSTFRSGEYAFNNVYTPAWNSWGFWSYSSKTDTDFVDYTKSQWNAITGQGYNSPTFAVLYDNAYLGPNRVYNFKKTGAAIVPGMMVTNSAWVVDAILHGDGMSGAFEQGDYFKAIATGIAEDGSKKTTEIYLADYRGDNHSYINTWQWVDLSVLGPVTEIQFTMESTKHNDYGMTTPAYMCVDNFGCPAPETSIDAISEASEIAAPVYYDLTGRQVINPQNGIFIRVQNGHATKIRL